MSTNSKKVEVTATPETKKTAEEVMKNNIAKEEVTTKQVIMVAPPNPKKEKSIKDIIEHNANQSKRIDKLQRLYDTHKKLDSFRLGSDRFKDTLSIEDGEGNTFTAHNSDVIAQVIELIKGEVLQKADETEKEIQANNL